MDRLIRPSGQPELDGYLSNARIVDSVSVEQARSTSPTQETDSGTRGSSSGQDSPLNAWLLGTGTPATLLGRSGPSTLLRYGKDVIVVDCGNGAAYQLARLGIDPREVTHIFVTHHHLDHNVDLPYMILSPWIQNPQSYEAPTIIGPAGTGVFVERMLHLHEYDLRVRKFHGYSVDRAVPRVIEVADGAIIGGDGWSCRTVEVEHYPVETAFGYRFAAGGTTVVISGDTRECENLIRSSQGVDLLIHEAIFEGYGYPEYHTLAADVGKVATKAGVKRLALTHLIPGHLADERWLSEVRCGYDGPVVVGHDLLKVL